MKVLSVVQRYGVEVFGGAEQFARKMATQLVQRGHHVDVATSCATSYYDWANVYEDGDSELDGVGIKRFATDEQRDWPTFGPLNGRVLTGWKPVPQYLQRWWMQKQGPSLPGFREWLWDVAPAYDVVVFNTYMYWPTWAGLPLAAGRVPTVLHPLAHDEPTLGLSMFDLMFKQPSGLAFLTEEEQTLVQRRFSTRQVSTVTGIGMHLDVSASADAFRVTSAVGDRPYVVCVGRIDAHKGSDELFDFFVAYKKRNPGPLALVVVGEPVTPLPEHPDVFVTGFVDDTTKDNAVEGSIALIQPSYFESFSMVLTEAWAQYKPALVNGHCEVLAGQARRSDGAISYRGFAEFEAGLDMLVDDAKLVAQLGKAGRRYVEQRYEWNAVMTAYEHFLESVPVT